MSEKKAAAAPKKAAAKKAPAKKAAAKKFVPPMKEAVKKSALKKPKTAAKKPVEVKDGITFPDAGFHIAVLGALLDKKAISAELIQATLEGIDYDDDTSETERLLMAMARLHALKVDPKKAAQIQSVDFDGGNVIYMLLEDSVEVETGGEDDTYELKAITGIGALSNLRGLNMDGHGYRAATLDLAPLEGHPKLEFIRLTGKNKSAKTLETLPNLQHVDASYATLDTPKVLERLEKRGVEIQRRS